MSVKSMETTVGILSTALEEISTLLEVLEAEVRTLESSWSGEAQQAYSVAQAEWTNEITQLRRMLSQTTQATHGARDTYRDAETRLLAKFSA